MNNNASLAGAAPIVLTPGDVDLATLRRVHAGGVQLALDPAARAGLLAAQATVRKIVESGDVVYGINTGFGKLAQTIIPAERLDMPAAEPCLLLTRRTWTRTTPVTMVRCLHPATRYRLGSRFRADGNPSFG